MTDSAMSPTGARIRLLQRLPGGEIRLAGPFTDGSVPAYAILSHRWESNAEQEVSYQDMIQGLGREKKGFQKLRFCAEQASEDQLEHFWIDTCCINKLLHGEHQAAMNSMFRWYQRATKCYVYLADVSVGEQNTTGQSERTWQSSFQASQWFLRGWTLQELLAPRIVEFFSQDGVKLGDKETLQDVIHDVTGISVDALQGRRLTSFRKEERLAWMERRTTKFEEDKVYALLGIFEVELVIHYGQGWASTMAKLEEAINVQTSVMRDLRITHPRDDKSRIEKDKGGLLAGVCDWIFDHRDFQRWRETADCQSLWIRGDPGKGKTMLICSIVDELTRTERQRYQLCYFFCQATDTRINSAVAVLRGLLYMLVDQQPSLIRHIEKQHHQAGRTLFEDVNNWIVLTKLFSDILQDPQLNSTIFIIDALDECSSQLTDLLHYIASVSARSPRVKWLYSSRDWPTIEETLSKAQQMLHLQLELNARTIAAGVRIFSEQKVRQLAIEKGYSESLQQEVLQYFQDNAGDTFLWVALVCRSLHAIPQRHVRQKLHKFPPGLDALYARMMVQIEESDDVEYCKAVLATVALALRPLTLPELGLIADLPEEISYSIEDIADIARRSGCFLTMRGDIREDRVVSFVHQSAKDYIIEQARNSIFPAGMSEEHARVAQKCIQRMCEPGGLQKDICRVRKPGIRRTDFDSAEIAKRMPARVTYTSSFWAEHFIASRETLHDDEYVHRFLQQYFLYWFEALSWMGNAASAVLHTVRLQAQVDERDRGQQTAAFLNDAYRFASMNRYVADLAPLQLYLSALTFTPVNSIVRKAFLQQRTDMFSLLPNVFPHWSATLQTLTGHMYWVKSVAFSADGTRLASGSDDRTVRLWDAATGAPLQTLEGHTGWVTSTLTGHTEWVSSVAFSADGTRLASGSDDRTVRLWDAATGAPLQTLEGHTEHVQFSADSTLLLTDCGRFAVSQDVSYQDQDHVPLAPVPHTLQLRGEWIQYNSNDILWLPHDFRGTCSAAYRKTLVIGQRSGAVSLFRASDDSPVELK
ncbi:uncharacterized protein K489DRAFT_374592 [Dissoconium aciculare CBS 342.82]|uniref:NACHT domain-containing protein n=1 Tax=Dissoconium aciculare CBS 342.82 TaxID=1314786 RepID=A0A6J3LQK4_9PEZI|nr:uncharacterized protein K489DRAFT_374592 [Dissoconium aciculare CBS 342.82]KAF1818120.1 hypothetical protein K489DRAFT_374592 [Dissoconium aciculare CBS 342.82]